MRNRWLRYLAVTAAAVLFLTACPEEEPEVVEAEEPEEVEEPAEEPEEPEEVEEPADDLPVFTEPSISDLDIVFERDRFTILLHTLPAEDRLWSDVFDNVNVVYSDDPVAPLVGGAAWIVQAEPGIIWPALEQGVVCGEAHVPMHAVVGVHLVGAGKGGVGKSTVALNLAVAALPGPCGPSPTSGRRSGFVTCRRSPACLSERCPGSSISSIAKVPRPVRSRWVVKSVVRTPSTYVADSLPRPPRMMNPSCPW